MKIYAARGSEKTGFLFATDEGTLHPCCKAHKARHDGKLAADVCFYKWAVTHNEEFECPPDFPDSACQFLGCRNRTRKGLKNDVAPSGRYLCDDHRDDIIVATFTPFIRTGYQVEKLS